MKDQVVLRVVATCLTPAILLFGLYIITHGELGPGGGFQGGVVVASAFILHAVVHGRDALLAALPLQFWRTLATMGLMLYVGVGYFAVLRGGRFLDYALLAPSDPPSGEPWGMTLVEYGVGLTVCAVMVMIYIMVVEPSDGETA